MTIRDEIGRDMVLTLKQSFIDRLKVISEEWANSVSVGDEIVRQTNDEDSVDKIKIGPSSLRRINSVGDTSWKLRNLPNVVFYASFGDNVNALLKRKMNGKSKMQSTDTEALHECFFVICLAKQIESRGQDVSMLNVLTLENLIYSIESTSTAILDVDKIRNIFLTKIESGKLNSEVNDRKVDAYYCAVECYKKLSELYNIDEIKSVSRIFEGLNGKKVIEDVVVNFSEKSVHISLKYLKGQLNNLSCVTVVRDLFGIDVKNKTFMDDIYEYSPDDINEILRFFVSGINFISPPKDGSLYIEGSTITYPEFKLKVSENPYYPMTYTSVSTEMSKTDKFAQEFSAEYRKVKVDKIAGTIKRYIDSKKTPNCNFVKFLSYILRCKPDDSYMYVGDTGRSIYIVPSTSELMKMNISLEIEEKPNRADYASMIKVYVDGQVKFEFELNFRWTQSQWVGDLSQVGKHLKVHL